MFARLSRSLTALVSLIWLCTEACGESSGAGVNPRGASGHAGSIGGRAGASSSGGVIIAGHAGTPSSGGSGGDGAGESGGAASGGGGAAQAGVAGDSNDSTGAGQGGPAAGGKSGGDAGSAGITEAGAAGAGPSCPQASASAEAIALDLPGLSEASGLCASRLSPGIFFTHNDSGTASDVYAFTAGGSLVATLELSGALSEDWEDIGVGPGPEAGKSYLYVADIGDNDRLRTTSIVIQRAAEPALSVSDRGRTLSLPFESLYFSYPDEPHNAETLLVDPNSGDLYIATKGDAGGARVYVAHAPHSTTVITVLEYVTTLPFGQEPLRGSPLATGGSVAPDGSALLIRTYDGVFLWWRAPGTSLAQALLGEACALPVADEAQGEGVTFAADPWSYYTLGEGNTPKLSRVPLSR